MISIRILAAQLLKLWPLIIEKLTTELLYLYLSIKMISVLLLKFLFSDFGHVNNYWTGQECNGAWKLKKQTKKKKKLGTCGFLMLLHTLWRYDIH